MINPEELAICRRRGHVVLMSSHGWTACTACGMWLREKHIVEEREDEPPEDEMSAGVRSDRAIAEIRRKLESAR
jgi:hypothetical protein